MRRILRVAVPVLLSFAPLLASPVSSAGVPACVSGNSLATYQALSGGCLVGSLLVRDFTFSVLSSSGGAIPIAATNITVTTVFGPSLFGLAFGSAGFSVSGTQAVSYLIGYTWDPTDIRSLDDILDPGTVDINTSGCVGAAFIGTSCGGSLVSLHVSPSQPFDSVSFAPTDIVGVRNVISLAANGGTASFNAIGNNVMVPEPASVLFAASGLALMLYGRRRKDRSQASEV